VSGVDIFGIGRIEPTFHCTGTVDDVNERFIRAANGAPKNGAPIFRNQDGILSNPAAVCFRPSRISNIRQSDTGLGTLRLLAVLLVHGVL